MPNMTYLKVNGELSKYNYKFSSMKKRPKCPNCNEKLYGVYLRENNRMKTIGYFCRFCKQGYINEEYGKFFNVEVFNDA